MTRSERRVSLRELDDVSPREQCGMRASSLPLDISQELLARLFGHVGCSVDELGYGVKCEKSLWFIRSAAA